MKSSFNLLNVLIEKTNVCVFLYNFALVFSYFFCFIFLFDNDGIFGAVAVASAIDQNGPHYTLCMYVVL